MNQMEFNEKKYIYILKAFAIFSVVCAHSAVIPSNSSLINTHISNILHSFGSVGVPVFFMLSGYLFYKNDKNFPIFFKGKIKTIFMPWLFCETIVWLYVVLRKGEVSLSSWSKFIIGYNHSTYYLTVLILLFILYFYLKRSVFFIIFSMIISIFSILSTYAGVNIIDNALGTPYLNPLNWMLYFSMGLLIKKYNLMEKISIISEKILFWSIALFCIDLLLHLMRGVYFSYWSKYTILNTLIFIIVIFGLSKWLLDKKPYLIIDIGKQSFSIYLLHELFVGGIVYFTSLFDLWYLTMSRPFIILTMVYLLILVGKFIMRRLKINNNILMLIGAK